MVDDIRGKIRGADYGPRALTHWRMRDMANDGSHTWRHVGRRLPEIPTTMDRSIDEDQGGRLEMSRRKVR